jgi:hypothetical protein
MFVFDYKPQERKQIKKRNGKGDVSYSLKF